SGGKYLYFFASTNYALRTGWLEMSSLDRPSTRAIYVVVLSANEPSPLLPETGDEPSPPPARPDAKPAAPPAVRVDFDPIRQRILRWSVPAGDYSALVSGMPGTVFYAEASRSGGGPVPLNLHRYQLRDRRATSFLEGIRSYSVSGDAKKLLYSAPGNRWGI